MYAMAKTDMFFQRQQTIFDGLAGWRFNEWKKTSVGQSHRNHLQQQRLKRHSMYFGGRILLKFVISFFSVDAIANARSSTTGTTYTKIQNDQTYIVRLFIKFRRIPILCFADAFEMENSFRRCIREAAS